MGLDRKAQGAAIVDVLKNTPEIVNKMGTYTGTALPIIQVGSIAEEHTALPAITLRPESNFSESAPVYSSTWICNIFAATELECVEIADLVHNSFLDLLETKKGVGFQANATILPLTVDQPGGGYLLPVEINFRTKQQ